MGKLNPKNKVDLTSPELTIIVEVIKAVCCLSVVKDYTLYRKYNVQEVLKEDAPETDAAAAKTDTDAAEQTEEPGTGETDKDEKKGGEEEEEEDTNAPQDKKEVDEGEGGGE